ncbi:MAG: hypothetical protein P4L99_20990 [Chthoniobacter sp.]|nr:hypothetical protein [Chthoniobacter sp.]
MELAEPLYSLDDNQYDEFLGQKNFIAVILMRANGNFGLIKDKKCKDTPMGSANV